MIKDTLNPDFVKKFIVDYYFEESQKLRFEMSVFQLLLFQISLYVTLVMLGARTILNENLRYDVAFTEPSDQFDESQTKI